MNRVGYGFLNDTFEQHRRWMLVEQNELRIDVRFDRKFTQQTRAEAVNRGDDRSFERALVSQPCRSFTCGCRAQQRIDTLADALSHFIRSAICKRNRNDVVD